jgi:hypothetical protein
MNVSEIKRLATRFEEDLEKAMEFSKVIKCRAAEIIILPIPTLPSVDGLSLPDQASAQQLSKFFDRHPTTAIVVCVGEGLQEKGEQYGMGYCINDLRAGDVILMKLEFNGIPIIYKHAAFLQITPQQYTAKYKSNNVFTSESKRYELTEKIKESLNLFNNQSKN